MTALYSVGGLRRAASFGLATAYHDPSAAANGPKMRDSPAMHRWEANRDPGSVSSALIGVLDSPQDRGASTATRVITACSERLSLGYPCFRRKVHLAHVRLQLSAE